MGELSGLREHSSVSYCLNKIPLKVRRGLSIVEVQFTSFDVVEEFIAIGTNIGVTYWCNRKTNEVERLRPEKYGPAITLVKVVSTVDHMVAAGDLSGVVSIFVIPKTIQSVFLPADHDNVKRGVERFTVADMHRSPITAITWSMNGQKLFTGDDKGVVVYTEMDFHLNIIKSTEILNEKFSIVQLAYRPQILVVASEYRCIIYKQKSNESIQQIYQVGQEEHDSLQKLGVFIGTHSSQKGIVIFSARPKQRIWLADMEGNIHRTLVFEEALTQKYSEIQIWRPFGVTDFQSQESSRDSSMMNVDDSLSSVNCNFEFRFLHGYKDKYLIGHNDRSLVLLNVETTKVEMGYTTEKIISIAVNKDEIFVLEGYRQIRRLSSFPDPYCETRYRLIDLDAGIGDKLLGIVQETSTNMMQSMIHNFKKMENAVNSQVFHDAVPEVLSPAEEALDLCYPKEQHSQKYSTQYLRVSYDVDFSSNDIVHKPQKKKFQSVIQEEAYSPCSLEVCNSYDKSVDENKKTQEKDMCGEILSSEQPPRELGSFTFDEVPSDIMPDLRTPTSILKDVEHKESLLAHLFDRNEEIPSSHSVEILPNISEVESQPANLIPLPEEDNNSSLDLALFDTKNELTEDEPQCNEEIFEALVPNDITSINSCDISAVESIKESNNPDIALIHSYCEKYWKQTKVPFSIKWICVSRLYVLCGSLKQSVYQSTCKSYQLKWMKQKYRASRMAVSQSCDIVWKLDLGVLYALKNADNPDIWKLIARNVESIAVNDWSAWYVSGGAIFVQTGLSKAKTFSESSKLKCFGNVSKVTCFENYVWALTINGVILSRELVSAENPLGSNWKTILHPDTISISDIALGTRSTGWIVDKFNNVYFSDNFLENNVNWWQVIISRHIYKNDSAMLFWSKEKPLSAIGSGSDSIWITASNENSIFINRTAILGHDWKAVPVDTSVIYKTRWKFLGAAGENEQTASVWCLSSTNDLFLYLTRQNYIRPVEMPTTNDIVSMTTVPDMMWILTDKNDIFVRRGISEETPFGWTWERLHVYQVENSISSFKRLSIGRDVIWAVSSDGKIFAAIADLYSITRETFVLDWIQMKDSVPSETKFVDVVVGPNKYMVWALDDKYNVYTRQSIFDDFPFGTTWVNVPGIKAVHLSVSPSAVWALTTEGYVYRRSNITAEDSIGEYWAQIPGCLSLITASVFENIWGVSKSTGRLLKYENHILGLKTDFIRERTFSENIEDEWEMVRVEDSIYQIDD